MRLFLNPQINRKRQWFFNTSYWTKELSPYITLTVLYKDL